MKCLTFFTVFLLLELTHAAPTENLSKRLTNKTNVEKYVIYTADYDIDRIIFSMPSRNNKGNDVSTEVKNPDPVIFFALADFTNGQKVDKGFYIRKGGEITKLLDHGRDAASTFDSTRKVIIAAKDGLYAYDALNNKAEKYGTVTDDLIDIARLNGTDIIYVLTKDHTLYKVTENGMKKEKIIGIGNPEQIVVDNENNLYYLENNQVKIFDPSGTKKIEGLPDSITYAKLIRPPLVLVNGIPIAIDNNIYVAFPNGTTVLTQFNVNRRSTAYSLEGIVLLYVGYEKKIYEYNIFAMILDRMFAKFTEYLTGLTSGISFALI